MTEERVQALRKTLGANIREVRSRLGLTQEQMAERLEMSPEVYGRMERGLIFPRVERFVDICDLLGESADRLLGMTPSATPPTARVVLNQEELLPVLQRLLPVMQRLTPPQRAAVRRHMAGFQRMLLTFLEAKPPTPSTRGRRKRRRRTTH